MTAGQVQVLLNDIKEIDNTLGMIEEYLCNISESLWKLSKCVGYVPPTPHQKEGYYILRIGGSVDTGNY